MKLVSVEPTQDRYRKTLKHLPSKIGFRETGPATWPMDTFTQRRLREGSIRILGPVEHPNREAEMKKAQPQQAQPEPEGKPN
jgi:hypothetical protein